MSNSERALAAGFAGFELHPSVDRGVAKGGAGHGLEHGCAGQLVAAPPIETIGLFDREVVGEHVDQDQVGIP